MFTESSRRIRLANRLKSTGSLTLSALGFALGMQMGGGSSARRATSTDSFSDTSVGSPAPVSASALPVEPLENTQTHDPSVLLLEQIILQIQGLRTDIRRNGRVATDAIEDIREQQERQSEAAAPSGSLFPTSTSPQRVDNPKANAGGFWSMLADIGGKFSGLGGILKVVGPLLTGLGSAAFTTAGAIGTMYVAVKGAKKLEDHIQANPKSLWSKIDDVMTNDKYRIPLIADIGDMVGGAIDTVFGLKGADVRHNRNIGPGPAMSSVVNPGSLPAMPKPASAPPPLSSSNTPALAEMQSPAPPMALSIPPPVDETPAASVGTLRNAKRLPKNTPQAVNDLHVSQAGLNMIAKREGLPKDGKPYWDVTGWAIGYGDHTYKGMPLGNDPAKRPNITITPKEAEAMLIQRLRTHYEPLVKRNLSKPIPQNQFDALVSVAWNSEAAGAKLAKQVDAGQTLKREDFTRSGTVKGQPFQPLIARREGEFAQFASVPVATRAAAPVWKETQQVVAGQAMAPVIMAANMGGERTVVVNKTIPAPVPIRPRGDNRMVDAIQSMNTI